MKKHFLLIIATAILSCQGIQAQMADVTAQYITNAGFEECEIATSIDGVVQLIANDKSPVDYADNGWKLKGAFDGSSSYNAGVAAYPIKVKYSKWLNGLDGPTAGPLDGTNTKALCFTGNKSAVYIQTNEITLPAGTYTFTVNVWAYNGGTTNPAPTIDVTGATGFVASNGTEYLSEKKLFTSSGWDTDVLEIELTTATTGRFQLSYGSSYFVAIDDIKLEYQGGIVTTALANVVTKAQALNGELNSSDLAAAIQTAEEFIDNPTTQDDVTTQVETLYNAMATALAATTTPVNITAAYLENASFESGKIDPWTWVDKTGTVGEPVNEASAPFIDGKNVAEFVVTGTNGISQEITHLPAGYYAIDAKLNQKAFLKVGTSSTLLQGGTDALYLRVHPAVYHATSTGSVTVAAQASVSYRVDNFRLFYGKDEVSLLEALLPAVKADAEAVMAMSQFDGITGSERTTLQSAVNGSDIDAINTALNTFVNAKDDYAKFEKAKKDAAEYKSEDYPYADATIYQEMQDLMAANAESAADAKAKAEELTGLCYSYYVSNAYCEGVKGAVDCTSSIVGANATGTNVATAWHKLNMEIRTDKTAWVNPKTSENDNNVYGVTADYYRTASGKESYMWQTVSGLAAGKYVLSVTYMSAATVVPEVQVDGVKIGDLKGVGTYNGVYGGGWVDNVFEFEKTDGNDMELRLRYVGTANYQDWYFDNLRLYRIEGTTDGIDDVNESENRQSANRKSFDMQGRRVAQPSKGLYIVNGRKVMVR